MDTQLKKALNPEKKIYCNSFPYNFMLIENFFNEAAYESLVERFNTHISKGKVIGNASEHEDSFYHALNYTPTTEELEDWPLRLITSKALKDYLSGFFATEANDHMILGMHQHNPPTVAGWAHTDFNIVSFAKDLQAKPGQMKTWHDGSCTYCEDTVDRQPETLKFARHIACIYYLGNPDWIAGESGGETGIYSAHHPDIPLIAAIPPINNSLFMFEINPLSYHGFLEAKGIRNSLIWWYHCSPAYATARYKKELAFKHAHISQEPFEYWTKADKQRWTIDHDPEYRKYFTE